MRLIDRHALLRRVYEHPYERSGMTDAEWCRKCIYEAPTIEAEPVRHGRWKCLGEYEEFSEEMADYLCESCGYVISRLKNQKPKFCEGCGALMDATDTNDGGKGGNG
jgi:hypothetical protein